MTDRFEISTDVGRLDRDLVHHWLSTDAYWAMGRSREVQDRAIDHSLNFAVLDRETGAQVAYARIVTDHATFAWLCDVYVDRAVRGAGVGQRLVTAVRDRLEPCGVRRILLVTGDAHGMYEKIGFRGLSNPEEYMALGFRRSRS